MINLPIVSSWLFGVLFTADVSCASSLCSFLAIHWFFVSISVVSSPSILGRHFGTHLLWIPPIAMPLFPWDDGSLLWGLRFLFGMRVSSSMRFLERFIEFGIGFSDCWCIAVLSVDRVILCVRATRGRPRWRGLRATFCSFFIFYCSICITIPNQT